MVTRLLKFVLCAALLPTLALAEAAPPASMQLFLLIGQSNMAGRGKIDPADNAPHPRVFTLTKELNWVPAADPLHFDKPQVAGVGLGSSFARKLADQDPSAVVGLIPAAFGGTKLEQWAPGSDLYNQAVSRTREALKRGRLVGILWHQGEGDSDAALAATYVERFAKMIAQLRHDLEADNVPVIVGETGQFRANASPINHALAAIPSAVPNCAFVSSEGLKDGGDKLHFDTPSLRLLGVRYAEAWLKLPHPAAEAARAAR